MTCDDPFEELADAADTLIDLLLEEIEDPSVEPYASALARYQAAIERTVAY